MKPFFSFIATTMRALHFYGWVANYAIGEEEYLSTG